MTGRPAAGAARSAGPVVLELADAGLLAWSAGGALAPPSPGYALADGGEMVTGRAARARARLMPRRAHHRFWHRLDETPLPRPFPRRWTHVDLAHRHLRDLRRELAADPEAVIAAVPGDATAEGLARFAGIAAAAGWPLAGLVDAAVAAATTLEPAGERAWHLDLGLHRAVLCELALGGATERRRVLAAEGAGLVALERSWARFFARRLVRATRFDPLHSAASEQRLYSEMEGWLERLAAADELEIALAAGGREHRVAVTRREVAAAAAGVYERIAALLPPAPDRGSTPLLLTARAARLPGLAAALAAAAGPPRALPEEAAVRGALAAAEAIVDPGEELPFIVRLPARDRGAA